MYSEPAGRSTLAWPMHLCNSVGHVLFRRAFCEEAAPRTELRLRFRGEL
jgi:hypothetical protein